MEFNHVIDLRATRDYDELAQVTTVPSKLPLIGPDVKYNHIPLPSLVENNRLMELPPSHLPLLILSNDDTEAYAMLQRRKKLRKVSSEETGTEGKISPDDSCEVANLLKERGWAQTEVISDPAALSTLQPILEGKEAPLWTIGPLVPELVKRVGNTNGVDPCCFWVSSTEQKPASTTICLDLGSGVCRDAIALCRCGWNVVAVDQRSVLLKNGRDLAERMGVATGIFENGEVVESSGKRSSSFGRLITVRCTVKNTIPHIVELAGKALRRAISTSRNDSPAAEQDDRDRSNSNQEIQSESPSSETPAIAERAAYDVVYGSRFLVRAVLPEMMRLCSDAFGFHHFVEGSARPTSVDLTLRKGELREVAEAEKMRVILDENVEIVDGAGRRVLTMFIARRQSFLA